VVNRGAFRSLAGPQGQSILVDTVSWIVNATLRPPPAQVGTVLLPDNTHVAFNFGAQSNLDYLVQYRDSLGSGNWIGLQDLSSAPTNRFPWVTNDSGTTGFRYFRLKVGP